MLVWLLACCSACLAASCWARAAASCWAFNFAAASCLAFSAASFCLINSSFFACSLAKEASSSFCLTFKSSLALTNCSLVFCNLAILSLIVRKFCSACSLVFCNSFWSASCWANRFWLACTKVKIANDLLTKSPTDFASNKVESIVSLF